MPDDATPDDATPDDTTPDDTTPDDTAVEITSDETPDTTSDATADAPAATPDAVDPVEAVELVEPAKPVRRRARRPAVAAFSAPAELPTAGPVTVPAADPAVAPGTDPESVPADAAIAADGEAPADGAAPRRRRARRPVAMPTFQAVDPAVVAAELAADEARRASAPSRSTPAFASSEDGPAAGDGSQQPDLRAEPDDGDDGEDGPRRRRRGRRGRGRGRGDAGDGTDAGEVGSSGDGDSREGGDLVGGARSESPADQRDEPAAAGGEGSDDETEDGEGGPAGTRRRRRRRRSGGGGTEGEEPSGDDPPNTVVRVREPREPRESRESRDSREPRAKKGADADGVRGVAGSTRLEAKRQRRRDGRTGTRRAPIVTEAEYLARREAVDRTMVVRNQGDRTQIAVLEDGVLVEHYVTRASATAYAGNVYLGKVQNVLPSMEAAFVDIGKGRNAVLYAGEVNYETAGLDGGRAHSIQEALKSGQNVLVQVTKDPIGQKGARLTSQITLPGRYLVYVPEGSMTGISRKLPDTERARLKSILKKIVPDDAGVIIRTAAEGASEEELSRDVERLQEQWQEIQAAAKKADKHAPAVLHAEPDLVVRVVRDVFNEDFTGLVVQGRAEWETIEAYVSSVAPDLLPRLSTWTSETDVFTEYRVDEQLVRALDRKVHLPSGGSLVIDRAEAMTVVDVNTGKFTGKGGNLEETVTKNNLEAAEELVRQLRLRDVGGIIVIDFIDMVLESNRELVLRRLTECLGRDRTRHQVAEVTSLGLVQMTRKRVGTGLLEAYSEPCLACQGRGVLIHMDGAPAKAVPQTYAAPVRKGPVPRPPDRRPDSSEDGTGAGDGSVGTTGDTLDAEVGGAAADTGTADIPESSAITGTSAIPDPTDAAEIPAPGEDAPPVEPVAPPVRRRRRATSGGTVSADPEQVPVA